MSMRTTATIITLATLAGALMIHHPNLDEGTGNVILTLAVLAGGIWTMEGIRRTLEWLRDRIRRAIATG